MSNAFIKGRPTGPDVEAIIAAVPVESLTEGATVDYVVIAEIIGAAPASSRFSTVTDAWRRKMSREHNIVFGTVAGNAFIVLNNSGRINLASDRVKSGVRRVCRAGDLAERTHVKGLTPDEIRAKDHIVRVRALIHSTYLVQAKKLRYKMDDVE